MQTIKAHFDSAKAAYDSGACPIADIYETSAASISKLQADATTQYLDTLNTKRYDVFSYNGNLSRPFLPGLYVNNSQDFKTKWDALIAAINSMHKTIDLSEPEINQVLYAAITAFSCCYDIWNPGARKTPGTFLEVMLGTILSKILPNCPRTKFITIPGQSEKVSTDIVLTDQQAGRSLVIPAKITTRERVVQPFAHQRILNSVFGNGTYGSVLMCVSEMQRAGTNGANEICVPGTIRLFQVHLAEMDGIYYLDPPHRYLQSDITSIIEVGTIGGFIKNKLPSFF